MVALLLGVVSAAPSSLPAQSTAAPPRPAPRAATVRGITSPTQEFGFPIGADYHLVNYTQLQAYWTKLAKQSDRMKLIRFGTTAEGRPMLAAIITSPENQRRLEHYRRIAQRLALAKGLTDAEAHALAREGKAVVWIDGGLHATEVLGAQQLIETVYELVSRTDPEVMRWLRDDIVLCVLANPDGMELVSNWYNRNPDTLQRSTSGIPRLYQKYVGHDNNRDFFMANQPETEAMNRLMYREWYPLIVYNHHQTGPEGTVIFTPPFRDPFNYNFDPLVPMELDLVGAAMHTRFLEHDLRGFTMRSGANYSTWWNGGLRTMPYFHNMIGLLTEAVGNPTPIRIPLVPANQLPRGDLPAPIAPQQTWHFAQSMAYELNANWAVLDLASRYREHLLYNIYQMGRNAIERGSRDHWTVTPRMIDSLRAAVARERGAGARETESDAFEANMRPFGGPVPERYYALLHDPAKRDPRVYIIPANQPDFPRATKFVNILIKGGVAVERATAPFTANGVRYPAGSYVVKTAQAFRPHVLDMFEPQDHPNDFAYPGGPPKPPYDITGWTPALQMGIQVVRLLDDVTGPFAEVTDTVVPPPGRVAGAGSAAGWLVSHAVNNGVIVVNRLLAARAAVYWLRQPLTVGGTTYPEGTIYIPRTASSQAIVERAAAQLGVSFDAAPSAPSVPMLALRRARVGLWDEYGGSIPSGWIRWLFDQYEVPYEVVYPPALDAGQLRSRFDVLVFPDGAIPLRDGRPRSPYSRMPRPDEVPEEYRARLGEVTVAKTVPQLRTFLEGGGTILAIGSSTNLGLLLGLPMTDALVKPGTQKPLTREEFYIPGSVLEAAVDPRDPLAYGIPDSVAVFFDHSPAFHLTEDAASTVRRVAWFDSPTPLRSGWAWGQQALDQSVAVIDATVGKGKLFLFGPEITFRGQPHGTFPFLFNGIFYGPAIAAAATAP
ncbi:MAG: peptidase [Gemmatimonadaceae bacterium]|nr:peptidase [Gemmatimonadaceae bacterium]